MTSSSASEGPIAEDSITSVHERIQGRSVAFREEVPARPTVRAAAEGHGWPFPTSIVIRRRAGLPVHQRDPVEHGPPSRGLLEVAGGSAAPACSLVDDLRVRVLTQDGDPIREPCSTQPAITSRTGGRRHRVVGSLRSDGAGGRTGRPGRVHRWSLIRIDPIREEDLLLLREVNADEGVQPVQDAAE